MTSSYQYVDGINNVSVVNGMVHLSLVVLSPAAGEGQQPAVHVVQNLVMALPQFTRLCADMGAHIQRMEERGLIQRRQPQT
jgi:hypothetical protein